MSIFIIFILFINAMFIIAGTYKYHQNEKNKKGPDPMA